MKKYFRQELYDLDAYVPGEQPDPDSKVIKLNTNENPYPPSPEIQKEIDRIVSQGLLRRYPNPVSRDLRNEIAKHHGVKETQILVTNGSDEGLAILFRAVLGKKNTVVTPYPTYSLYPVLTEIQMNGSRIKKIPLKKNLHFNFKKLAKAKGALLAFAHPNAPTGILEKKEDLVTIVNQFDGIVLCDEAYIDFAPENSSLIPEIKEFGNLIISRTFSKSYSLTGIRVGYLVGSENSISLLSKLKDSYNVGMIEEYIALAALKDQAYFLSNREKVIRSRENLKKRLKLLGFGVTQSEANFLFVRPPQNNPKELFEFLRKNNVFIRYFTDDISKNFVRISIGTEEENNFLISAISDFLKL
ncbi:MAG: histidinol-phosphate transaminase [Leptospira sp.]|nr:histidinol-phosphate transaminase [Leptospira sp.]